MWREEEVLESTKIRSKVSLKDRGGGPTVEGRQQAPMADPKMPPYMAKFFDDVATIKENIRRIRAATKQVGEVGFRQMVAASPDKEDEEARDMQKLTAETKNRINEVKAGLQKLKESTEDLVERGQLEPNEKRIRQNLYNAISKKFVDTFDGYRTAQQKYAQDVKSKVKRQVTIIKPDASDEFIEGVMQEENGVEKLYEEVMLKSAATEITAQYERTVERYNDAKKLEQSVMELSQMFLDFAVLVEEQGELIDNIEQSVVVAMDRIEAGNANLEKSIVYQKSARKWMCFAVILIMIVIIALLGFMGVFSG